ncbi:MAG: C45 family autoproteolytic acyltransferase/hydrolase [Planctomycetes bacterium]|nr:C45 family autoproteolytic acyltransferase/hydrolase [Planctomycetota bacterium]
MRKSAIVCYIFLFLTSLSPALFIAVFPGTSRAENVDPYVFVPGEFEEGRLVVTDEGVPVLHLAGDARERGLQYGTLCKIQFEEMSATLDRLLYMRGMQMISRPTQRTLEANLPEDAITEMKAIAEAAEVPYDDILFMNLASDLFKMFGCSAIVADGAASNGEYMYGRNLDYNNFGGIFHKTSLIVSVDPDEGNSYISVSFVGLVGVLSGMNEHGLTICTLEIPDGLNTSGVPYQFRYREVLMECETLADAIELIDTQARTTNNCLVVADGNHDYAVIEQAPEQIMVRYPDESQEAICQTNHYHIEEMKPLQDTDLRALYNQASPSGTMRRYNTLCNEVNTYYGSITREQIIEALDDANQGGNTIQSMIFYPDSLDVEVAFGEPPTSGLPFHRVNAERLFTPEVVARVSSAQREQPVGVRDEDF